MPEISVIVTTYNRKSFLTQTINSILDQTFIDFELIIVDNYSNFEFFEFIESFNDSRIQPFQNQNNGIIAVNRNFGMKQASGNYFAFCDDDDIWLPEKLITQLTSFKDALVIGVGSEAFVIDEKQNLIQGKMGGRGKKKLEINDILINGGVPLSTLMIRNSNIYFDESENCVAVEDYEFQIKLLIKTDRVINNINKCLILYRVHDNNYYNSIAYNKLRAQKVLIKYRKQMNRLTYNKSTMLRVVNSLKRGKIVQAFKVILLSLDLKGFNYLFRI